MCFYFIDGWGKGYEVDKIIDTTQFVLICPYFSAGSLRNAHGKLAGESQLQFFKAQNVKQTYWTKYQIKYIESPKC